MINFFKRFDISNQLSACAFGTMHIRMIGARKIFIHFVSCSPIRTFMVWQSSATD